MCLCATTRTKTRCELNHGSQIMIQAEPWKMYFTLITVNKFSLFLFLAYILHLTLSLRPSLSMLVYMYCFYTSSTPLCCLTQSLLQVWDWTWVGSETDVLPKCTSRSHSPLLQVNSGREFESPITDNQTWKYKVLWAGAPPTCPVSWA